MKFGSLFIKRPVMTSMIFLGVALFGILAWTQLAQELFPNISVPQLVIITKYPNAAPEEIENLLTKPLEEAVGTVPNLKRVQSISKEGMSAVTLDFGWGTDMAFAHLATREKLDRMKDRLPPDAEEPIIKRVNPFSHPVLILSVTGNLKLQDMTEICKDIIKKKLEKTDGVGSVTISGGQEKEILVEVDRGRLAASRVSLPMVVEALKNANYDYPAGVTQGKVVEYLVRTHGRFKSIDDVGRTIVQVENPQIDPVYKWKKQDERGGERGTAPMEQRLISLQDMAEIKPGLKDKTSYSRYNGRENISISIQKHADANTVQVSKSVRAALDDLRPSLPNELKIDVVYDESIYIVEALGSMNDNVLMGSILAFLVLFFFLGNIRESVNVGLVIPVSILGTLIVMYAAKISINMLTLAGLALSVGSLSDCGIVVAENIVRHHKQLGKSLLDAAIDGTDEVTVSVISSMGTNVVVFIPLLFITGIAQQLFQDLILVTILTNFIGLLVSLILVPRMAAYDWTLPPINEKMTRPAFKWGLHLAALGGIFALFAFTDVMPKFVMAGKVLFWVSVIGAVVCFCVPLMVKMPVITAFTLTKEREEKLTAFYETMLKFTLDHPWTLVQTIFLLLVLSMLVMVWTPKVFMPKMDQGQFIVQLTMPIGTRLEITNNVATKLEHVLQGFNGVNVMMNVGSAQEEEEVDALDSHEAQLVVTVTEENGLPTETIISKFQAIVSQENIEGGHLTYLLQDSPLRAALAGGAPVEVEVKGPDLGRLKIISDELTKAFETDPYLYGTKTTFALPSREAQVVVDKDRAAGFQLSVADIAKSALIAIKGIVATEFKEGGKNTDIRVRLREQDRLDNNSIRQLSLRSPQGMMVPLDAVAKVNPGLGASEIRHLDQQRSVVVTAEVNGISVDKALDGVRKRIEPYRIKDYTVELAGESRRVAESFSSLKYTFILAILLVYMIMASQFESFIQPLIIMSTVPFSFIGIAFTLFLVDMPFSAVVALGVLILAGIVVNNGIVLIDLINVLRAEGKSLREAVISGSTNRLRPILMTAIVTMLGSLPLAIGIGKGDELASPLAVVTLGGMFVSTLLTLLVIPLLYFEVENWMARREKQKIGVKPGMVKA